MGNKIKMEEITTISAGLNIKRIETEEGKEYKIIKVESINNNQIKEEKLGKIISNKKINEKYFAKKGDVILGLYSPYKSAYINKTLDNLLIPHDYAIIRSDETNPEYIAYQLNNEHTIKEINKLKKGSRNSKITLSIIKELKIETMEEKKVKEYVNLIRLINERIQLREDEISELKNIRKYFLNKR